MQARPDRDAAIQLSAGESLFVYLKAGTTITSTAGGLKLTGAPRWLGGQVFYAQATLAEGEAWLRQYEQFWNARLDALDAALQADIATPASPNRKTP